MCDSSDARTCRYCLLAMILLAIFFGGGGIYLLYYYGINYYLCFKSFIDTQNLTNNKELQNFFDQSQFPQMVVFKPSRFDISPSALYVAPSPVVIWYGCGSLSSDLILGKVIGPFTLYSNGIQLLTLVASDAAQQVFFDGDSKCEGYTCAALSNNKIQVDATPDQITNVYYNMPNLKYWYKKGKSAAVYNCVEIKDYGINGDTVIGVPKQVTQRAIRVNQTDFFIKDEARAAGCVAALVCGTLLLSFSFLIGVIQLIIAACSDASGKEVLCPYMCECDCTPSEPVHHEAQAPVRRRHLKDQKAKNVQDPKPLEETHAVTVIL